MSKEQFVSRHIGPRQKEVEYMLSVIGKPSIDALVDATVPAGIRLQRPLDLPAPLTEQEYMNHIQKQAKKNKLFKSYIGLGYYNTFTPSVIRRNIFENPGWYTAYTPYQAEIAQGRLEALLNYQTVVCDLTGLPVANASLLDEGTAAGEAMTMLHAVRSKDAVKRDANKFFVSDLVFPQTVDVLKTRAIPLGFELVVGDHNTFENDGSYFGVLLQYPAGNGEAIDYKAFVEKVKASDCAVAVAADLLSLTLLTPPGEWGADVVVGTSQRFGVPMGYGGPHAAFFATKEDNKRFIPGRIIGVSVDMYGHKALRMALQTREQHIKRDKATSNICTAQALLAIMAGMYAVYHGADGLKEIATRINNSTNLVAQTLKANGVNVETGSFFDTITIEAGTHEQLEKLRVTALSHEINFYYNGTKLSISLDETTTVADLNAIIEVFSNVYGFSAAAFTEADVDGVGSAIPSNLQRTSNYLTHPIFNSFRSESEMMRYIKRLENKDLSLVHSMISLGSCTMKLNAASELIPLSIPEFGGLHPFVPADQALGYREIFINLEKWLCEVTGFAAMSLQPNSGAQGEYAGLMVIRAYHLSRGDAHRNIALIPQSAHGTNPASAAMAGMQIVVVKTDENGNVDIADLKAKAEQHSANLSCLMVTYPSTHGVFEEGITEITNIIHQHGGQVYMDGANMNAQVGLTSPGNIGADVCHLNLHKTFAIPHGGGGPGMGPIGVAAHLAPFLPKHAVVETGGEQGIHAVSAAPWGSSLILLVSYAYIAMLGAEGLTNATKYAILNANYLKQRLKGHFPVLYEGKNGTCAHEMILDCRDFKRTANVEVADIAKRLMDYGFHAPTVSFPVAGTIMVEPTESEALHELDRFAEAMISIREEIAEIENGTATKDNNVVVNAPHTAKLVVSDAWDKPYSREKAAYPLTWLRDSKFWPSVAKIDNAYGDRNLVCTCLPMEAYAETELAN